MDKTGYLPNLDTTSQESTTGYLPNLDAKPETNSSWEDFQQQAQKVVSERGVSPAVLPVLLAQSALESARGTSGLTTQNKNYFGIKGRGTAGSANWATQEFGNGGYYGENSDFAAYNNPTESINAYLDLIQSYPGVSEAIRSGDPDKIIKAIKANGYATSPSYVQDVENTPEFNILPQITGGAYGSN